MTQPKDRVMGTSDLYPNWTEVVGNMGTHSLRLASEVGGNVMGSALAPISVRTALNCRTLNWCWKWVSVGEAKNMSEALWEQ